ncbi:BQ5605_C015g07760 [Microbotryum silenes-dioicae]|uniref:BQ5605_C015g07760 protein n=1 Tax=Microbotryum silenes-dioicae TaxID=796604 RepID=A0A2X0LSS4_9BASI|nr:BQ5605_C015g07760 [Microbotryum silenes-dioicae]
MACSAWWPEVGGSRYARSEIRDRILGDDSRNLRDQSMWERERCSGVDPEEWAEEVVSDK